MSLRLGFHYHIPMTKDTNGKLLTAGYLGLFLDSLAINCENLTCFMHFPRTDEFAQMDYVIQSPNIFLVDIGLHASIPKRMLNSYQFCKPVREHRRNLDALLIRGPSPLLPAMAVAAGNLPVTLLLVGDYLAGINDLPQPLWRREAIRLWSWWNYRQQKDIAKKSLTFVNSYKLYEQLKTEVPNLVEIRTTTLDINDFYRREDTCQSDIIHLLYAGRIDRTKGLFEIVEAVAEVTHKGYQVVLDLVGGIQKGDTILDELTEYAERNSIKENIIYHGFKSVGPELFNYYQKADLYLIASQSDFEGFPRTIWEAMAHSVPVIATKVGSIPYTLTDNIHALLVDPKNPQQIAEAIINLISGSELRRNLIKNAMTLVYDNTLDKQANRLISELLIYLGKEHVSKNIY